MKEREQGENSTWERVKTLLIDVLSTLFYIRMLSSADVMKRLFK